MWEEFQLTDVLIEENVPVGDSGLMVDVFRPAKTDGLSGSIFALGYARFASVKLVGARSLAINPHAGTRLPVRVIA